MQTETAKKATKSYYLDPKLSEKLERQAVKNRRSASAELEVILEKALSKEVAS